METSSENDTPPPSNRDYICPCGKSYLSYAAIFTHIKLKHAGKPPGPIRKPKVKSKPRGRPPLGPKKDGVEKLEAKKEKTDGGWKSGKPQNKIYWEQFQQIFNYLKQISYKECIDQEIWEKVEAFQKIQNFINSKDSDHDFQFNGVNIGRGLSEFFKHVSNHSENWRFEQIFVLFSLLLQYVIDENNDDSIVNQAPIEYLIQYMNSFISDFIQDEGERLGIQNLWMMRKQNIVKTFYCFYNWLKWKEYTDFSITLNRS